MNRQRIVYRSQARNYNWESSLAGLDTHGKLLTGYATDLESISSPAKRFLETDSNFLLPLHLPRLTLYHKGLIRLS